MQQQGSHPTGAGPGEASENGSFAAAQLGQSSPKLFQQALAEHVYLLASAHEVFRSQAGSHAFVKLQSLSQSCHDACKPQLFCGLRGLLGACHSCSERDIAHAPSHLNKARSPACQHPPDLRNNSPSNMDGFVLGQVICQVAQGLLRQSIIRVWTRARQHSGMLANQKATNFGDAPASPLPDP